MNSTVVITGAGKDRVGIVCELAEFLFRHGCNLLDSSMTLLRGEFALILMVSLPEDLVFETLAVDLDKLGKKLALNFSLRKLEAEEIEEPEQEFFNFIISVYGADKPGIVAGITSELAKLKLNITDVQTKSLNAESGEIFVMILESSSKTEMSCQFLQEKLSARAKVMGVDVSVREIQVMEL